ncbi:MAG: SH3 domain-containing protein [Chitinophagales bacterium]|nr:SH3 domain-containing protein [Chitinophagales bacterium]
MKILTFACFAVFTFLVSAQNVHIAPKNEVYKDSSLTDFICKLQYAFLKQDTTFLLQAIDENVYTTFDGVNGKREFVEVWNLKKENSDLWIYLSKIISLGGVFLDPQEPHYEFVFPYVFAADIPGEYDYEACVITSKNVNVRKEPDSKSEIIGKVSYEMVLLDPNEKGIYM